MQNGNALADGYSHNDSGFLHRAPNSSRSGKGIVRRPTVPLTSVPEQTNFASQPHNNLDRSVDTAPSGQTLKRPALAIRTSSPFPELNGSAYMASTPKPKFDPVQAFRNSFLSRASDNDEPSGSATLWKGKEKALPSRDDSMERMRQSKLSAKAVEIREWLQGKSGTGTHRASLDVSRNAANGNAAPLSSNNGQLKTGTIRNLFKNNRTGPAPPPKDRGPKPGQTYEIVNRRVVENNPDRTVEISTWREQPMQKSRSNDEDIASIYYLSADEYPQDGEYANSTMARVEWNVEASDVIPDHPKTTSSISGKKQNLTNGHVPENEKMSTLSRQHSISFREAPSHMQRTISPSLSEKAHSLSAKAHPVQVTVEEVDNTTGSSTPVRNPSARRISRQRGRYKEPSTGEKELPRSPMQPIRSASTISRTQSDSSVHFEGVLQSCEPSLAHIAPVLRKLGMRSVEHLRAVGKLTPVIRDREIKEDALKLGITIVEWAILLDKVLTFTSIEQTIQRLKLLEWWTSARRKQQDKILRALVLNLLAFCQKLDMSRNKHLIDNFAICPETKEVAYHLFNLAKLNTGEGSGRAVGEFTAGLPAACVLMAVERLNTGEVTRKTAQAASCLKPKDFAKVYESTKAAVEQAEKATCITYNELYTKYKLEGVAKFLSPWITQTENELLTLGYEDNQMTRCAVYFWVCNAIKSKSLPETAVFAKSHELPCKPFVTLLELLNKREPGTRKNIQVAFKAKSRSPRKDAAPLQAIPTPSRAALDPTDAAEQESPIRRSNRINHTAASLPVVTPTSTRKRQPMERSQTKVAQPPPLRIMPGRKAPLRELPSKDPKKRPAEETDVTDKMDVDELLFQTPKKRRTDPVEAVFPIPIVQPPVTPSRSVAFSPTKKKSTIPLTSLPEPSRTNTAQFTAVVDDTSTASEDESEVEESVIRRRFRPVFLEHKQWLARDPRVERMWKKASKKSS